MSDTLPATLPDLDLDLADAELADEARKCAVAQWNNLPAEHQAVVPFDALVDRHKERLARKRQAAAGP